MAAKERTPDRAKAVLDRAVRRRAFRAPIADRRLFDPQIKTPGVRSKPFDLNGVGAGGFVKRGRQSVALKDIISDQPSVSVKSVKGKIDVFAKGGAPSVKLVRRPDGKYMMLDGNHGATAARALGKKVITAHVFDLQQDGTKAAKFTPPATATSRTIGDVAKLMTGKGGKAAIVGAGVYAAYRLFGPDKAQAAFIGERAETADRDAIAKAKAMHAKGADRHDILKATGQNLNPAGQWRTEIDDSDARLKTDQVVPNAGVRRLGDVLHHPELFKAYPSLRDMKVSIENTSALDGGHLAEYDPRGNHMYVAGKRSPGSVLSTVMHEAQHGIQTIEGDVDHDPMQKPDVVALKKRAITSRMENATAAKSKTLPLAKDVHADEVRMRGDLLKSLDYNRDATAAYVNMPSENEAFAVSARLTMSAAQRRITPPWASHLQAWPHRTGVPADAPPEWHGSNDPSKQATKDITQPRPMQMAVVPKSEPKSWKVHAYKDTWTVTRRNGVTYTATRKSASVRRPL